MKALAEKVDVAAAPTDKSEAMRKAFDVTTLNSWVVVLDAKGELLDSYIGDSAGSGCTEDTAAKFPGLFAARIETALKITASVEELKRRCEKEPRGVEALEAYVSRLEELDLFRKAIAYCDGLAADKALPEAYRNDARVIGYLAGATDFSEMVSEKTLKDIAERGEALIADLPDHPKADQVLSMLFSRGYAEGFDVPTRSAAGIERLEKRATANEPLQRRVKELKEKHEEWILAIRNELKESEDDEYTVGYLSALLGDAAKTIEIFSKDDYKDDEQAQEWLKAAREKLARTK